MVSIRPYTRRVNAARRSIALAIETSNPSATTGAGAVCLGELSDAEPHGVRLIDSETLAPTSRHDDALMPAIDRMFRRRSLTPRDLARVAVSIGPGGFTAVRIAVVTAKMIALATGAELVGVPTALGVARRAEVAGTEGTLDVLLAWKHDDAWRQRFVISGGRAAALDAGGIVTLERALADAPDTIAADAELQRMLNERAGGVIRTRLIHPEFDPFAVLVESRSLPANSPGTLVPLYPREPEAVTKWRAMGLSRRPG